MTYATLDPSAKSTHISLSGGNLTATPDGTADYLNYCGNSYESSGQLYCEVTFNASSAFSRAIGICQSTDSIADGQYFGGANTYGYEQAGTKRHAGGSGAYGATYANGDVISILLDLGAGTLVFWKNGVSQGTAYSGLTGAFRLLISGYQTDGATVNFGATAFVYSPPGGFVGWPSTLPGTGSGASSMLPLFALGSGPNGGAVSMQSMTAAAAGMTVYNAGTPVMQTMSAAGIGSFLPGGAVSILPLTATSTGVQGTTDVGEAPALEPLTAAGTGIAVIKYVGAASLQPLTATGVGTSASVGAGVVTLQQLTAEGHVASTAAVSLQQVTASAVGATGTIGAGAAQQQVLTANGAGVTPMLGSAAVTLQPLTASGVGATLGTGTGAALLQQIQVAAAGFGGTVGTAALQMALATAQATGHPVVTGTGQVVMPAMSADGRSTQAVVAAYNTWVMNTRNLDLTEYTNYNFDSYTEFMGLQLASGPAGITQLTGADDAGIPIAAIFKTGNLHKLASQSTDERSSTTKLLKIPEILMTVDTEAPLTVTVEKEDLSRYSYQTPYVGISTMVQVRVTPGKALRALDYRIEVANNNGAAFDCVELNVPLEETKRRLGDK